MNDLVVLDRSAWAALGAEGVGGASPPPPLTQEEWDEVYRPLASVIGQLGRPCMIGLTGSVAAGKSTVANGLAAMLRHRSVAVVSTDGFLLPNSVLGPRGRLGFKGFPDTYDHELMDRVVGELATGTAPVEVPRYSHELYDIASTPLVIDPSDVVILEGINAFSPSQIGVRIYVDADEPDLRTWYVTRFLALIEEARSDPASFYAQWTGLGPDEARALAVAIWEGVNLVNLTEHILATRMDADIVMHKGPDHRVTTVAIRPKLLDQHP